jgi:chorismate mutase
MELEKLRGEIDRLDRSFVQLLNRRVRLAEAIGALKKEGNAGIFDPVRERLLLRELHRRNPGALSAKGLCAIYREILSECRAKQGGIRVGWLTSKRRESLLAALLRFGIRECYQAASNPLSLIEGVATGQWTAGVLGSVQARKTLRGLGTPPSVMGEAVFVCEELLLPDVTGGKVLSFWLLSHLLNPWGRRVLLWLSGCTPGDFLETFARRQVSGEWRWRRREKVGMAWLCEMELQGVSEGERRSAELARLLEPSHHAGTKDPGEVRILGIYDTYELV